MTKPLPSREQLIEFIQGYPDFPAKKEIAKAFRLKGADRRWLRQELNALAADGLIERKGRRLGAPGKIPAVAVIAVQRIDKDGDLIASYAEAENPALKIIVLPAPRGRVPAVGDRVLARMERESADLYTARVIRVLEKQSSGTILGIFRRGKVHPVDRRIKRDYMIPEPGDCPDGELVVVERTSTSEGRKDRNRELGPKTGRIVERLGKADSIASASAIALAENEVRQAFPEEAIAQAEAAAAPVLGARQDLRTIPLITIDGADARDFDDAVYAERTAKGFKLLVAIADVAHYVKPGSALDQEAEKRGNSVYLPDRVIPMLPEALSNGWCSLNPDEERACLAAWITLSPEGRVTDRQVIRGLMKSAARCTYEQVQAVQNGEQDHPQKTEIAVLFEAYEALDHARKARGTLDLDLPEFELVLDEDRTKLVDVRRRERLAAHKLIEEFMILANVAVAETLEQQNASLLFRVHDQPDRAKIEALNTLLKTFSLPTLTSATRPKDFAQVLRLSRELPASSLISEAILRSQSQAIYSPSNGGHFGLALTSYAHFTSPIRRYADLIVHRALITALELPGFENDGMRPGDSVRLTSIGEHISKTERAAAVAERTARERILTHHLAEHEGAAFNATIVSVTRMGCFVALDDLGAQGLLPFDGLPRDRYRHLEESNQLVGEGYGEVFSLGDRLSVRLRQVDVTTASLTFEVKDRLSEPLPVIGSHRGLGKQKRGSRPKSTSARAKKLHRKQNRSH